MAEKFFISDTHFFHANILKFTDERGALIRGDDFSSVEEMNETIVQNWNSIVKPQDKVYHLGDVALGVPHQHEFDNLIRRLNGHKRLYLGNHDHIRQHAYRHFDYIELWSGGRFQQQGFVCSHIPLREDQMRKVLVNVHGHIHQNVMDSPYYINVCVEHTDYKPVHIDEIITETKNRNLRS